MNRIASIAFLSLFLCGASGSPEAEVRPPAVAGQFYPEEPDKLAGAVKGFLADALPACGERPIALIVPHAGYVFSGQIAADAYRQAADFPCDLVVILGTNHTTPGFRGVSVYAGEGFRTPLGVAQIDQEVTRALLKADPLLVSRPEVHVQEHSVEVQIPFVQVGFPNARIAAAVVSELELEQAERLGQVLARTLERRNALIVASSDLSHYPTYEDAVEVDGEVLRAIASLDLAAVPLAIERQLQKERPGLSTCACGEGAVLVAMAAAKALGARRGIVVSYANSGDTVFGEPSRVVGYGAIAFTAAAGKADLRSLERPAIEPGSAELTEADKKYLLALARKTIERFLETGTVPLPRASTPGLRRRQGAFVTLKKHGDLRGCIGHMEEDAPLALTVARMALQAAFRDPRFRPVEVGELPDLEVEISALTPFARVPGPQAIVVGRDGVVLEKKDRRAVFLPQVAPEQGWSRDEMLGHLCLKAGLSADCWHRDATFFTFQAEVFGEGEPR